MESFFSWRSGRGPGEGEGEGKGKGHDHCAAQERRRKQLASRSPIVAPITTGRGHPRAPFITIF